MADDGHQVILDIYQTDEFFGESALLNLPRRAEQATAMENTRLMSWTTAEIEDMVTKRPRLAVALLQILAQRTMDFGHRIESFSVDNIARRLARSLIRFSERLGTPEAGRLHAPGAVHARVAIAIRGHLARDRHALHESVPPPGLPALLPQRHLFYRDAFKEWLRQDAH